MIEQLCFDEMVSDEKKAFDLLYPEICDIIMSAPMDSGVLIFEELKDFSSVYFMDTSELFFRIRLRKKSRYILIPDEYIYLLSSSIKTQKTQSEIGMTRILIQSCDDILKYTDVLRAILAQIYRNHLDFGCCGRYQECSDIGTCIHPDPRISLSCWYRYNLLHGKVFYGKHKNIT